MSGPMQGYRVIDLSVAAAGPFATAMLADQGADVIKVERPGGDLMRTIGTVHNGVAAVFAALNRNKRGVCIDLKQPRGVDAVLRLTATADVVVHNMRPGVAERLGLGYDDVCRVRPDIVYVAISGWGETGPRAHLPAYDSVVQAAAGVAAHQGGPNGEPTYVRNAICDKTSGLMAAQLTTAALLARARTGEGQRIGVSMLHASLAFLWPDGMQNVTFLEGDDGGAKATNPPIHRTADGWVSITAILDTEFRDLCKIVGRVDLVSDSRFAARGERSRNAAAMWAVLDPILATWPTAALVARLEAAGVPHAVVRELDAIGDEPQVIANHLLVDVLDPAAGPMRMPRAVGEFSGGRLAELRPAPRLGEHTDAVLGEIGYSGAERESLRAERVIFG